MAISSFASQDIAPPRPWPTVSYRTCLLLLWLMWGYFSGQAQNFTIQGPTIYDPNGQEFIPVGANVNAFNYHGWPRVGHSAAERDTWRDCWKFNCLRANTYMYTPQWEGKATDKAFFGNETEAFQNFDNLVNLYTPAKVVVMFEVHDFTGTWPTASQTTDLKKFWGQVAARYKNNPYVWFNIMNEPGADIPVPVKYRDIHREVIQTIRDQGAGNIIIVDGTQWGQESGSVDDSPIPVDHSGVLKYGQAIVSGFSNVAFNFHLYEMWAYNATPKTNKYNDYIDRVRGLNLCTFVGEVGSQDNANMKYTTELAYNGLKNKKVGMLAWHYAGGDGFKMVNGGSGNALNSCANPTNLTALQGSFFWKATHQDGFGLGYQGASLPPGNLVVNGGLESDLASWSGVTGSVSTTTGNVRSGSKALAVAGAGAWVQNNLSGYVAGQAYKFSAWGKVAASGQKTIVGLKGSGGELKRLEFTATSYAQQMATVTVPAGTSWLQVFVEQPGAGTGYVDDVSLTAVPPTAGTFSGTYRLTARHSGKALDIDGASTANEAQAIQLPVSGRASQYWKVEAMGNGTYKLTAQHSGKCLDVSGASTANGARVQQYADNGNAAQRWKIEATSGGYYKLTNQASGKVLDVAGGPAATADGVRVQQWTYGSGLNQQWQLDAVAPAAALRAALALAPAPAQGETGLRAYPNPSPGPITLTWSAARAQPVRVALYNQLGQLVRTFGVAAPAGRTDLPLTESLAPGLYYLRATIDRQNQRCKLHVQ